MQQLLPVPHRPRVSLCTWSGLHLWFRSQEKPIKPTTYVYASISVATPKQKRTIAINQKRQESNRCYQARALQASQTLQYLGLELVRGKKYNCLYPCSKGLPSGSTRMPSRYSSLAVCLCNYSCCPFGPTVTLIKVWQSLRAIRNFQMGGLQLILRSAGTVFSA